MKLSTREDIDAPLEEAFVAVSDFDYLERQILRRGIQVVRTDTLEAPDVGMAWRADVTMRSQVYDVRCKLADWTPPGMAMLTAESGALSCELEVNLSALSLNTTRLRAALTVRAHAFRERMLLQSLQLAKARISRQFEEFVRGYAHAAGRRAAAA